MVTKQVYTNTIAQLAGKLSTVLISIFLIKILTNYLTIDEYGLYNKIYNYLSIFSVIADLGLYTITVREISACAGDRERARHIVGNVLTLRTLSGLGIIVLACVVALMIPGYHSPLALASVFIAGVFTLFGLVNSSILSVLQAYLRTEFSFVSTTVGKVANFVAIALIVFVLLPTATLSADPSLRFEAFILIMIAGLLGNIVMAVMLWWYAHRIETIWFRWDTAYIRHILMITLPYGLALFLNAVYFKADVVILSIMESHATVDTSIGLYSLPMKIVEVGMMFGTLFLNSLLPLFTRALADGDKDTLRHLVDRAFRILFLTGAGIVGLFMAYGRQILLVVASPDYVNVGLLIPYTSLDSLRIVVWIFLFYFLSSLFTYVLIAHEEQGRLLRINALLTVVNIIGNILLIPYLSFVGSSLVTMLSQILLLWLTAYACRHITDWRPSFVYISLVVLSGVLGVVLATLVTMHMHVGPLMETLVGGTVFGGVYLAGAYAGHRVSRPS